MIPGGRVSVIMSDLSIDFHQILPLTTGSVVVRIEPRGRENDENVKVNRERSGKPPPPAPPACCCFPVRSSAAHV